MGGYLGGLVIQRRVVSLSHSSLGQLDGHIHSTGPKDSGYKSTGKTQRVCVANTVWCPERGSGVKGVSWINDWGV